MSVTALIFGILGFYFTILAFYDTRQETSYLSFLSAMSLISGTLARCVMHYTNWPEVGQTFEKAILIVIGSLTTVEHSLFLWSLGQDENYIIFWMLVMSLSIECLVSYCTRPKQEAPTQQELPMGVQLQSVQADVKQSPV